MSSILVFVESTEGAIKKSSIEAVCYAKAMGGEVTAIFPGNRTTPAELEALGRYGVSKVFHVNDDKYDQGIIQAYATVIADAMEKSGAEILVLADSALGTPVAAKVAVKADASLASNVTELPDTSEGFTVKRSIYTGKAFATVSLTKHKKILTLKKNAVEITEVGENKAAVETFVGTAPESDFAAYITKSERATGEVLLPEAEIVVSGGRGLKGAENWGMIEELANLLGAATGCSKPVSDMGWRPHHEHVGQTGIKVSPQLYIAIGISGAIQHLAGVNSSKNIVVINKDPEAPFFTAADYGIVGDAFEVVPKLIETLKAAK